MHLSNASKESQSLDNTSAFSSENDDVIADLNNPVTNFKEKINTPVNSVKSK